uniref:CSON010960 protein n=1 Tax=Culicoides sonorensis TaxID=179676 RepID=A0A336LQI9_CULSO
MIIEPYSVVLEVSFGFENDSNARRHKRIKNKTRGEKRMATPFNDENPQYWRFEDDKLIPVIQQIEPDEGYCSNEESESDSDSDKTDKKFKFDFMNTHFLIMMHKISVIFIND